MTLATSERLAPLAIAVTQGVMPARIGNVELATSSDVPVRRWVLQPRGGLLGHFFGRQSVQILLGLGSLRSVKKRLMSAATQGENKNML